MSIDELYKNGYTVLPSLISSDTCDKLAGYLNDKLRIIQTYHTTYYKGHDQLRLPNNEADIPQEILLNTQRYKTFYEKYLVEVTIYILIHAT